MIAKLKAWWNSLPESVRVWLHGLYVAAEGGAIGFLAQWAADPVPLCFNRQCLRHFIGAFLGAIVASVRNWLKTSPIQPPKPV